MAGQADARERGEHAVEGVGELRGRGGEQDERTHHERHGKADGVEHGRPRPARGDGDGSEGDERIPGAHEDEVEEREHGEKHHERAHRRKDASRGDACERREHDGEKNAECELGGVGDAEDRHQDDKRAHQLDARVEVVDGGACGEVLPDAKPERHPHLLVSRR